MVKFNIEPTHHLLQENGYQYNVKVLTSVDGGRRWYYCGIGKYVHNLTEAFRYIINY